MKRIFFAASCIISFFVMAACNDQETSADNSSVDSAKTANKENKPVAKEVSDFAVAAATGGLMEVQMGKLASEKAYSQRVKDFGNMMVEDHTKANEDLQRRAAALNIALPSAVTEDMQKEIAKCSAKTGKDFDKAYMNMMVEDHKKDADEFQKAATSLNDSSIREFAAATLPVIQKHLDSAMAITGRK